MKKETAQKIKDEFTSCAQRTIKRVQKQSKINKNPFHRRLIPQDILIASQFERSFVTSFGQKVFESISEIIALNTRDTTETKRQKKTVISLTKGHLNSINNHLSLLRRNQLGRPPSWNIDIKDIQKNVINKGKKVEDTIISDLWFVRKGVEYFFSIKTVGPNIDQTENAKKDMLKLTLANKNYRIYLALPYNPFGDKKSDYAHNPPFKIFDMVKDEVVIIGKDYWDLLGGSGTYEKILEIAESSGIETKKIINRYISKTS